MAKNQVQFPATEATIRPVFPRPAYSLQPKITLADVTINLSTDTQTIRPPPGETWIVLFANAVIRTEPTGLTSGFVDLLIQLTDGTTTSNIKNTRMASADRASFYQFPVTYSSGVDGPIKLTNSLWMQLFSSVSIATNVEIDYTIVSVKE